MLFRSVLYAEFFGDFVGILIRFCAEFNLFFHRGHKQLIIRVLIHHAHFFIPFFALFALLPEFSAYILQNMELPGFDREQQRLLVNLVRYHTGAFKKNDLPIFARYADEDVLVLLLLLRISVILNKSRQATDSTDKINLRIDRSLQTWELTFEKHYLDNNPLVWNELRLESNLLKDLELSLIFN